MMIMADPGSSALQVHRCRFVDFTPAAITSLAFPPVQLPNALDKGKAKSAPEQTHATFGTLAVGRANGNIELCEWAGIPGESQAPQAWVVRKTLAGPRPSKVDSIAFSIRYPNGSNCGKVPALSGLRLFSAGGGSELLEWDVERTCVRRSINSQGGAIWSFAVNPASTSLALGCEDGSVRLLSLEHDTLSHSRRFDRVKCRLLSIAWGPPTPPTPSRSKNDNESEGSDQEDDQEWTDEWLVTGGSDSALRRWDIKTGRVTHRMAADKVRGERTLVWTVGVLGNGTIISGDSLGMVKFWDPHTNTQLESFQGHGADVLCMSIGPDGTSVYTSGVDQKVAQFTLVQPRSGPKASVLRSGARWVHSTTRRLHSHDVRALASWPPYVPLPASSTSSSKVYRLPVDVAPLIVSGGLDMSVVLTPAALPHATGHRLINPLSTSASCVFEDSYHRRLAYPTAAAGTSAISIARGARFLCCVADSMVSVWRVKPGKLTGTSEDDSNESLMGGWQKILELELAMQTNAISSALSDDGNWLVISDRYETKLFHLIHSPGGDVKPKRVKGLPALILSTIPNKLSTPMTTGSSSCVFTPDSSKLVLTLAETSYTIVVDIQAMEPCVLRTFDQHRHSSARRIVTGRLTKPAINGHIESGGGEEEESIADEDPGSENDGDDDISIGLVSRAAVSADGQWLATTDHLRRTHVFNLDSLQHHCALPSLPHPAQTIAFDPSSPHLLVIAMPNNSLQIYDVESRQQPDWGRALTASLPKRFTHLHDTVLGVTFDPSVMIASSDRLNSDGETPRGLRPREALFWGSTWLCKVQLDAPPGWGGFNKKRRRGASKPTVNGTHHVGGPISENFKLITHYRPILHAEFIGLGELLVVERPAMDVLAQLPPAFWRPKYGAS